MAVNLCQESPTSNLAACVTGTPDDLVNRNMETDTKVLVVLSDNGIEEIPFVSKQNSDKENRPTMENPVKENSRMKKIPLGKNYSLPANLTSAHALAKSNGIMDYLQVPSNAGGVENGVNRRFSNTSIVSKSSLSSFGIYSAPATPTSLISPSPSNISQCSADVHHQFTFPEPLQAASCKIDRFNLEHYQSISKSAEAIRTVQDTQSHMKWSDTHSVSAIKDLSTKRKKSILQRIGSNMSEKSLLSRKLRRSLTNWSSGQNSRENFGDGTITFPKTKRSHTRQRFRIGVAKTGQPDGVSFELIDKPGFFLRSKGKFLEPEREGSDSYFNKDSTFVPLPDMWFQGFFAFESVGKPSFFIRLNQLEELILDRYDGTSSFKEDASFMLKKRPCTTCLQAGVKGWVKMPFGGYNLGKVVSVDSSVEVIFDDGKATRVSKNSQGCLIPDVVPQPDELLVGARVISQWLNRDFLYPGIITGIKSGEYEIQFDDGDKAKCQAYQIRLVRDHIFQDHSCHSPSHIKEAKQETQKHISLNVRRDENEASPDYQRKRQQFIKQRQGKLWSRDTIDEEDKNKKDSISSNESQDTNSPQKKPITKKPTLLVLQNLQTPLLETETMSQDSGYHGYQRQRVLRKQYLQESK